MYPALATDLAPTHLSLALILISLAAHTPFLMTSSISWAHSGFSEPGRAHPSGRSRVETGLLISATNRIQCHDTYKVPTKIKYIFGAGGGVKRNIREQGGDGDGSESSGEFSSKRRGWAENRWEERSSQPGRGRKGTKEKVSCSLSFLGHPE